jgi:CBS domain-containing protein
MKRNVISINARSTVREAAESIAKNHIGLLPVLDQAGILIGTISINDLLTLEMPSFFSLVSDLDFVMDFGAVEYDRPSAAEIDRPVTELMQKAIPIEEDSGMIRAYGLMLKHQMHDLPVVNEEGKLVGVVSQVDIGTAILTEWKKIGTSTA